MRSGSPRRCLGGRRRTGSGSPARLPGEILGRLSQDLAFGDPLRGLGFGSVTRARSLDTSCSGFSGAPTVSGGGAGLSGLRVSVPSVAVFLPVPNASSQCAACRARSRVIGDATHRRPGSGLVQVDGLPTELIGIVLAGHGSGSSRFPSNLCWIRRVQEPGSGPNFAYRDATTEGSVRGLYDYRQAGHRFARPLRPVDRWGRSAQDGVPAAARR